jgi:aminoglycoside phosphotransferase family enzyme
VSIPAEQQEVARFLSGLSGSEPKETHISAVFVGRDTVRKLKKAVLLPFLDFTSVDARQHFQRRELALNQPAAPEISRDVAAVVRRSDGSLDLRTDAQDATAVDWVLRMAPVPEQDSLDVVAARGDLTPTIQDALGDCVAQYHAGLRPILGWGSCEALVRTAEGNARSAIAGRPGARRSARLVATNAGITAASGELACGARCRWFRPEMP